MISTADVRHGERGFALVLALLTLLMLTFLGLSLAATTSTELKIAQNYRDGQQAFYNAEAGMEIARRFLLKQTWNILLPSARPVAQMAVGQAMPTWGLARPDAGGLASRNWENADCDTVQGFQGVGYGVVLDHTNFAFPFQNVSTYFSKPISGSFTVWVRRPITNDPTNGNVYDNKNDSSLVITVEGTAPFLGSAAATQFANVNRAVRVVQAQMDLIDTSNCENDFAGQSGLSALNPNYDACHKLNVGGVPNAVSEVNKTQ